MSTLSISGAAGNAAVVIGADKGNRLYNGRSASGLSVRPFGFVLVNDDNARHPKIQLYRGDAKYQFDTVTIDSGMGIVGKGAFYPYSQIDGGSNAPGVGEMTRPVAVLIIIITVVMLLAFCICSLVCFLGMVSKMRRGAANESPPPDALYDERVEGENDALSSGTESKPPPDEPCQDPEPPSPYDSL
jgi:uncharacterized spore protein YtfJ